MTVSVHLVRHGEVFNPDKVLYGRLPGFGLSSLGLQMAQELADSWETKPKILVSSPLKRAQETMAPLAKKFQLPVRTDQRVIERSEERRVGKECRARRWRKKSREKSKE